MKTDSLVIDSVKNVMQSKTTNGTDITCIYYIVALVAVLIIVSGVIAYFRSDRYKMKKKLKDKNASVDFDGVMRSAFMAKDLYDQLKGKCHPDKFATEPEKMKVATEIFALLVKYKHNYDELCKLKERAIKELNINL